MTKLNPKFFTDEELSIYQDPRDRRDHETAPRLKKHGRHVQGTALPNKKKAQVAVNELIDRGGGGLVAPDEVFRPSFQSSFHEREWILDYLGAFYDVGLISDVIAKVKGGKEANVYCCTSHGPRGDELVAAKLYRPRMFRNLRNDARYRAGRVVLDEYGKEVHDPKSLIAVKNGTNFGKGLSHFSWLMHEYQTLEILFKAGLDVPRPLACGDNTILMEYLGEATAPAPTLNEVTLDRREAQRVFDRLMDNVARMLKLRRIHGDLSAYNVLYWEGEFRIIDFPQAVDPFTNRDGFDIFRRDVTRLCQYFTRYGMRSDPQQLAAELWESSKLLVPTAPEGWEDDLGEDE
ncbi:serine/threonine protein kinase [Longilinea arvoryzae]|uniref:non-specific serine/threonine protein kinase n=1 Tax=Longilinea arvoryzae TaxID=360412 RepID=A0A0S7BAY5_9CHLR|nr:RIO1 family regulatory kinase/ATPase [Longilinea arvoryzae]GAP12333.1 serine/threonine protein kinase [Longilinea arvoryzae]